MSISGINGSDDLTKLGGAKFGQGNKAGKTPPPPVTNAMPPGGFGLKFQGQQQPDTFSSWGGTNGP